MHSFKLTRCFIIIAIALAIVTGAMWITASVIKADTDEPIPTIMPAEPESDPVTIPEGEPLMKEDPTEDPTEPPTEVPTEPATIMGTVNTDRLNVRKEPDINVFVIRQLAIGTRVEILEQKILDGVHWGRIEDGWINLRYVDIDGDETPGVEISVNLEDLHNLALINFIEAGQDDCCNDCRRRICDVVLNRIEDDRWPGEDTIAEVLLSPTQFAQLSKTGLVWPARAKSMMEQHAIERAYMIAEEVLMGNHSEVYQQGYVWYMGAPQTRNYYRCPDCNIYFSR